MEFTYREAAHFMSRVDRSGDCWLWTGCLVNGYGQVAIQAKRHKTHRVAYELLVGPIPAGLEIDHLCRNKACVNPAHLEPVTGFENMQRSRPYRMHDFCKRGHSLATTRLPDGTCRGCWNAARNERNGWRRRRES